MYLLPHTKCFRSIFKHSIYDVDIILEDNKILYFRRSRLNSTFYKYDIISPLIHPFAFGIKNVYYISIIYSYFFFKFIFPVLKFHTSWNIHRYWNNIENNDVKFLSYFYADKTFLMEMCRKIKYELAYAEYIWKIK